MKSNAHTFGEKTRRSVLAAILIAPVAAGWAKLYHDRLRLSKEDLETLRSQISGTVVARGDRTYPTWHRSMMWQYRKSPRQPDLIVQAQSVDDVITAVKFAKAHGLRLTTRCGGHSMSACFLRNDGILLDISRLDGVEIDASQKTVVAGPGVFGAGLNKLLNDAGLAFPTAGCGTVPISGFLLGGGIGVNVRGWAGGRSTFAIEEVDVVTADGTLRQASRSENPDLFWAVQGGGPGLFGVVTRFKLRCVDAPKVMLGATYHFRFADLEHVLAALDELSPRIDPNVECALGMVHAPASCSIYEDYDCEYRVNLDFIGYASDEAAARELLGRFSDHPIFARALDTSGGTLTLDDYFSSGEVSFPQMHFIADSFFTDDPVGCARQIARHLPAPSPDTKFLFVHMGDDHLQDAACSAKGRFYLALYHRWHDAIDRDTNRSYASLLSRSIKPYSTGSYINEMDQEGRPEDVRLCYSASAWAKLGRLRSKWDPGGVFQNFYGQA